MTGDMELSTVLRYCPRCGASALRAVGSKLVCCESCSFELYLNAAVAAAALIVDPEGRLLVVVRDRAPKKGMWDLPGGFADPGESAEEALQREIREELGLEITAMRYLCSAPNIYDYMGVRYATVDLAFVCEVGDVAKAHPTEPEVATILFLRPNEIDVSQFAFVSSVQIVGRYLQAARDDR